MLRCRLSLVDVSTGQVWPDQRPAYWRSYQTPFADRIRNEVGIARSGSARSPATRTSTRSSCRAAPTSARSGDRTLFRTGWGARAQDEAAFLNLGESGLVSPGPDVSAARWVAEHPNVVGFAVETVGIDAGGAGGMDPVFPMHNFLLGAGRYGLTQIANAEALPAAGAVIVVAPVKPVRGTGRRRGCSRSSGDARFVAKCLQSGRIRALRSDVRYLTDAIR